MQLPLDYEELLNILNRHKVKYLIVGAYAVVYYTEPRYTKDLDIWIDAETENAKRVYRALQEFGAPLKDIKEEDFTKTTLVYQIGVEPVRVDIIMGISGIDFAAAWKGKQDALFNGVKITIIGIKELIKSKAKTKRPLDRADIESLQKRLRMKGRKKRNRKEEK